MNRHCTDVRIWGPLVVAAAALLLRGTPQRGPAPATRARSVELPAVHAAPEPRGDVDYELDAARSSVRFRAGDAGTAPLLACPQASGRLRSRDGGRHRELELEFDLASLAPVGDPPAAIDPWRQLAVPRDGRLTYRATLHRSTTSDLPGVTGLQWLGTLRLGDRIVQQGLLLWQVSLPGQPLRLQGRGSIAGSAAPTAGFAFGLDLAWRRQRGN